MGYNMAGSNYCGVNGITPEEQQSILESLKIMEIEEQLEQVQGICKSKSYMLLIIDLYYKCNVSLFYF